MECSRCHVDNKPGRKFCSACGQEISAPCPRCGFANEPLDQFCGGCGEALAPAPAPRDLPQTAPRAYTPQHLAEKILTSRSALEGERKQVTVLFADVSGFTGLSARLDPEDVHGLMTRAFELMLAEVHRYEGTVNQFLGDGIMALFGAPIAHEDHAQRAVHAALGIRQAMEGYQDELQRRRGIGFQVRQGLNTGLVVVGSIGSDLRMDYTAVGDTTNVAARLQQAADPGRIAIADATHRLVGGYFFTRPLGELTLKGKTESVRAWEVISTRLPRTRIEVEAERGLTPFVGRGRELRLLMECFERARVGQGQVVFIAGEPGIGKSRLLYEFRRRLGAEATWLEGRCMSFGRSIAFHPLVDLLKRNFRIEEGDPEETIVAKIEQGVLRLGEDLRPVLPYVRYILAVDPRDPVVSSMDPQQRRGELFYALRRLLLRAAEVQPQVVVYEDVHWMDAAMEEYLALIADSLPASRVLQILTYRTGWVPPFGDRTYHTRIALTTLSTEDSIQMAGALLATERLPEDLQALIVRKAEGNPFFVEEVIKSLQEVGALRRSGDRYVLAERLDGIVVPDTVQDVVMARIDRLAEAPKRVLQHASVIGREFTRRLLDRIAERPERTEDALRELKALELIYEKRVFPEIEYTFKHALTQEVAYNSLLVARRKELHRLIGVAIESLHGDRLTEQYEVLAYHFSKAQAWTEALAYLLKAANKAARAFATREAITLYDQAQGAAIRLGADVPAETLMAIHQAKADLFLLVSDFERARSEGARVLTLARRLGDRHAEGTALVGMGLASWLAHKFDRALEDARQAIEVADAVGARPVLAGGHLITGLVYEVTGRLDEARESLERVIAISRPAGDVANESWALVFAAELAGWEARFDEASRIYAEGIQLARAHNVLMPLLEGLFMYGINLTGKGDYDGAVAALEEGLALAEKVGDENYTPRYLNSLGWLHIECGALDRALELNRRGADGARKRGDHESIGNAELNLGDIFLLKGDLPLAQDLLEAVHRLVKDPATSEWMRWRYSMHLFASLGELWLARGNPAAARGFADQCLELATRTTSRKYLVKWWRLKGEIALGRRQWDEAHEALRQALSVAQAIGNPTQLWKTHAILGRLHTQARNPDAARHAHQAARAVIEQMKAGLRHPELRASLESAPFARQVSDGVSSNGRA
ncbi:MAG: AAA family ATPase [Candidatus Rokubacteria bacterium]|nr:AAA family ATPase [Candidatus Rokubacteria bacterium]